MRFGLGFLPFSMGDFLYTLLIILLIRWILKRIQEGFKHPKKWITEILAVFSLLYACFNLFWGLNYYRPPLHQTLEIENEYTAEQLYNLTHELIKRSNKIHLSITGNDSLKVEMPYTKNELFDLTIKGYEHLKTDFPELEYKQASLKRSLYSIPLTYMGFNGYLNPLTNEGQVNTIIVPYKIPTTASHEIGHQLGFAAENEANFIACLATMNHYDPYFRYSGYTFALKYCLNEVYRRDPEKAELLLEDLNHGVRLNYREVQDFWDSHQNPFEPVFQFTYNSFLQANYQEDGMKSYSYVVALLVNYFQDYETLL